MSQMIDPKSLNCNLITDQIPLVMNALYNNEVSAQITLDDIRDAFRLKQIQGKTWLIENFIQIITNKEAKVLVVGGWLGFISLCLHQKGYSNIIEVDLDPKYSKFSRYLNRFNKEFRHITLDVNDLDTGVFDIIINTSCEHITDNGWFNKATDTTKFFLQSNDMIAPDHTNICIDLNDMKTKYPLVIDYEGCVDFDTYKRFMLIGNKNANNF